MSTSENFYITKAFRITKLREKCPNTESFLVRIFLYSDWIEICVNLRVQSEYRKIRTRNKSVFGHFSRSAIYEIYLDTSHAVLSMKYDDWNQRIKLTNFRFDKATILLISVSSYQIFSTNYKPLTHSWPIAPFNTPWKHQKNEGILNKKT